MLNAEQIAKCMEIFDATSAKGKPILINAEEKQLLIQFVTEYFPALDPDKWGDD